MADKQKQITVTIDADVYNLMKQVADDVGQTIDQYVDDSLRVRLLRTASFYETRLASFPGGLRHPEVDVIRNAAVQGILDEGMPRDHLR